jgi:hypothetical protein
MNNQDNLKDKSSAQQSLVCGKWAISGSTRMTANLTEKAMQSECTRRNADGSIDYDYYRRRAAQQQQQEIRAVARRAAGLIRPLVALALLIGMLLALPTHDPDPGSRMEDVAAAGTSGAPQAN